MTDFDQAFRIVIGNEGGVSSDVHDTAGDGSGSPHTNLGVTLKAVRDLDVDGLLPAFLKDQFDVDDDGDIDSDDVPGWTLETAKTFYLMFYWRPLTIYPLPKAVMLLLFDSAINMGQGAAIKVLQRSLRVKADGVIGPQTAGAARKLKNDDRFIGEMLANRLDAHRKMRTANKHFLGWARRCFSLHLEALKENY